MRLDTGRLTQVFVLSEDDWVAYEKAWRSYPHAIFMKLPVSLDCSKHMGDAEWTFNPKAGKGSPMGFSRLCIQVVAYLLKLDFVWMLDDNIEETRGMDLAQIAAHGCHAADRPPQLCKLSAPMKHIEGIVDLGLGCAWGDTHMAADIPDGLADLRDPNAKWRACPIDDDAAQKHPWKDRQLSRKPACLFEEMIGAVDEASVGRYVGAMGRLGILGMDRDYREFMRHVNPFGKTYSIYSFVLLNVAQTVPGKVLYSPKPAWEDIDFAFDLLNNNFETLKVYRWFHQKVNFQPPPVKPYVAREAAGEMYAWDKSTEQRLVLADNDARGGACEGMIARCGPWTLDPGPWTLDPGPWTLSPEPWTLDPGP